MRTKLSKIALAAGFGLSLAFTLSCSSDDGGDTGSSSSSGGGTYNSSSSGGGGSGGGEGNNISGYKTKQIGDQVWMAENLNYNVAGSKCYGDDPANCDKYGRLYDWATAMALPSSCNSTSCSSQINAKHKGICPSGWHIPSDAEWTTLTDYVGGSSTAGTKLKATSGWYDNGNGTDIYCFSALPGGLGYSGGGFSSVGYNGYWWGASEGNSNSAYGRYVYYYDELVHYYYYYGKSYLFSVRCLQD
jgi:uncharacterized protein (TIGR02145 family)